MLLTTPAAQAQWGPGWGSPRWDRPMETRMSRSNMRDPREGRVEVSRFVVAGPAADELGHGGIAVESDSGEGPWVDQSERAAFEAAIVDALVGTGYDTVHVDRARSQVAKLQVSRQVLVPAEQKRSPVSGSAAVSVGTRGSGYGLAVDVDMTKPRSALVATRLDARILDKAGGQTLWEGHATMATYEGDGKWSDSAIAGKLARALFDKFPKADATVPLGSPAPMAAAVPGG